MQLFQSLTEWALRFARPEIIELGTNRFRRLRGSCENGVFSPQIVREVPAPQGLVLSSHLGQAIFDLEGFQRAIRDLFQPEKPRGKYVSIVLPDTAFHFAAMSFPTPLFRANPMSLIEREIQSSAPLPLREYMIRYETGPQAGSRTTVFCCAVPHGLIRDLEAALNSLDLVPLSIQPSFLSSLTLLRQFEDQSSPYPSVYLHVGHESTTMAIFSTKGLKRLQIVPVGGLDLTRAIGRQLGLMFEQAEKQKQEELILLDDPTDEAQSEVPLFQALAPLFTDLLQKLYGFLQMYAGECPEEAAFRRIVLAGSGSHMKNFDRLVSSNLGIICLSVSQFLKFAPGTPEVDARAKVSFFPLFGNLALTPWNLERFDRLMAA